MVVATRDRPALLLACLDSLERQTAGPVRAIVVDDASRVPVSEVLAGRVASAEAPLVLRNEQPLGPGASRNRGAGAAGAAHLLFLDDDVCAHPGLVAAHQAAFANDAGRVVSIGALLPPPGVKLPPWDLWQADRLAREQRGIERGETSASWNHFYTGNVAVRRADFEAVGGFDTAFARQEDMELGYRLSELGCRFAFTSAALAWHDASHTLEQWLRIPAASARYDVLMDRLRPGSARLAAVRRDMREQHWLLRFARWTVGRSAAARPVERLAIAAGHSLHRVGADRLALPAFSLVWDLEYGRALAAAVQESGRG